MLAFLYALVIQGRKTTKTLKACCDSLLQLLCSDFSPDDGRTLNLSSGKSTLKKKKLEAKDVLPNINRTQAVERAENAGFVPDDLDL